MTPILLSAELEQAIRDHAAECYPNESCGLVVEVESALAYWPCRNISPKPLDTFIMHPGDFADAEDTGKIVAMVHSHPDAQPYPSDHDRMICNQTKLPSFIVSCDSGLADGHIHQHLPSTACPPLIGRQFVHGVTDCYQIVIDYYRQRFGVDLPTYQRMDGWWESGQVSLYEQNFEHAGFFPVTLEQMQPGDMIVMQLRAPVPNHAAVYDGDGYIIHHVYGRLSSRELYRDFWQNITRYIMRHRSQV